MENQQLFAIYFSGLVGWQLHPGYQKPGSKRKSVEECAALAAHMVQITEDYQNALDTSGGSRWQ